MEEYGPHLKQELRDDGVLVLTLNRPEALNALSQEMVDGLAAALERAERDRAVRCLVITGAGRGFCAGGDVRAMGGRSEQEAASPAAVPSVEVWERRFRSLRRQHASVPLRLYQFSRPTLALINGPVAGAGLGLACACDIRLASDRAVFTTAFARIGRSGDYGTTFFVRQLVGPARARELFFTADILDAETALRYGLVNHVYPHEELMERGLELARRLAQGPVGAYARMKEVMRAADAGDLMRALELEAMYMTLSGMTEEGREFLRRFLEERSSRRP
ncbi:MAG TPA: enoyl-CoA hydratase-related protein [Dehalococcoidia bacterium]|nr:enoyl-CoA hydratase-related protein [Dehalococcoidia bacterium]